METKTEIKFDLWYYEAHQEHNHAGNVPVTVHYQNTETDDLKEHYLRHIVHHSPTGMQMGYGGSGPADMALSILVHYFRAFKSSPKTAKELAMSLHQDFKWNFIAPNRTDLLITDIEIGNWLNERKDKTNES